ncbi:hypothetical protein [Acrocarpospora sp. B8E8]|uniref:hypothetical protein n=1 Tax=Acrocarpospora sp. B8E8 TaxID=3153572 RepID=UPI00325F1159
MTCPLFADAETAMFGGDPPIYVRHGDEHRTGRSPRHPAAPGVTWFLGSLAGVFKGEPFTARVRYTRTWIHTGEHGWRLVAAHVSSG